MTKKYKRVELGEEDVELYSKDLPTFIEELKDVLANIPLECRESSDISFDADGYGIFVKIGYLQEETQEYLDRKAEEKLQREMAFIENCKQSDIRTLKDLIKTYNVYTTTNLEEL